MNLFELFGVEVPNEPKVEKKAEPKTKKKNATAKSSSGEKKGTDTFKSPLVVFIGANPYGFTLEKEGEITLQDIKEFAQAQVPGYPSDLTSVQSSKDCAVVHIPGGTAKGSFTVEDGCRMFYGNMEFDISDLLMDTQELNIDDLLKVVQEMIPAAGFSFRYSKKENVISVISPEACLNELDVPENNVLRVRLENNEILELNIPVEPSQMSLLTEEDSDKKKKVPVDLKSWIPANGTSHPYLKLISSDKEGIYLLGCNIANTKAKQSKVITYETKDVELSLLFRTYHLTPDDFNGKEKVEAKEILKFLVDHGHHEFEWLGESDVSLQWNDKKRCILVSLKGSRKGALDGTELLPLKVPSLILKQWIYFSKMIYAECHTEVLMDLYYDPQKGIFMWYVPKQHVSSATVDACFEPFLQTKKCGLFKIGQFHSHGHFPAFFSARDNHDEFLPGIYGVIGNIPSDIPSFAFRLINDKGMKIEIAFEYIFSNEEDEDDKQKILYIALWRNQIAYGQEASIENGYPLVIFSNGAKGLLLSSKAEALFMEHVQGFLVHAYDMQDHRIYIAVSADDEVTDSFTITDDVSNLFDIY